MRISLLYAVSAVLVLSGFSCLAQTQNAPANAAATAPLTAPAKDVVFTQEQLDQMLAPIALYPDPLLAQVLMASTYPGEIAEAVTWSKAHPGAKGDDAVKQVSSQTWDPSVQALVAFPQVLATLGQDPVWVQRLGDAFLAQPDDVMDGVQRLRHQAQAAGNLQSNQYQNVTVQAAPAAPANSSTTIVIEPADPQVVYVPTYNPTTTYGTWAYPASPPVYYPPPPAYYPGSALMAGLAFGTGVAIVASLWGDCDWDNNDIDIDVDRYNNINRNTQINRNQNKWQHNSLHRDGVPYRDSRSREQYGRQLDGANQREAFRGDNAQRAQAREKARSSMDRHGIERPATTNLQARDQARRAQVDNRMQAGADRPRASDRNQGTDRNIRENQQPRQQNAQTNQRRQELSQTRQGTPKRPTASPGSARNNAFAGARSPSQSNAQALRGRTSQTSATRPSAARSAGHQISRPSGASMRQRGGAGVEHTSSSESIHGLAPSHPDDQRQPGMVMHGYGTAGISNPGTGRSGVRRSPGHTTGRSGTPDAAAG
ncbi:DUF3300 domain-containing protein [Pseudomonas chlororaphis]|uniref:Membrane protein n=1 Tax=Pseudomonas chlororaphis subsp. aureofaciens TaxID=587851 RepID=A0AAD0ZP27_9PSED|nr:DUF3300 domain-containing protein [Pseudomonas chlororaphis]AZE23109.1 putative membrane protein [Pseudomonas chlororaphis subsp. aureofaciens]AZE29401.1 putative membrane protein [Pseudomonas chlororaphis subsp. aureofaciens]